MTLEPRTDGIEWIGEEFVAGAKEKKVSGYFLDPKAKGGKCHYFAFLYNPEISLEDHLQNTHRDHRELHPKFYAPKP